MHTRAHASFSFDRRYGGVRVERPSSHSLQLDKDTHVLAQEENIAQYVNHACEPNAYFAIALIQAAANAKKLAVLDGAFKFFKMLIKLSVTPGRCAPVSTDPRLRP